MALSASSLLADFSYQEKTAITGGLAAAAMKVAGVFSKQAREPMVSTVSVKGDRLAHRSTYSASIIDLASQTITTIDLQKKTYSVMTFAEMKQTMEEAAQKAQQKDAGNMTFKVSANATGKTRQIDGLDTRELMVKIQAESTDQKSGQSGSMVINLDVWLAPSVAGYREVREFHRRMAATLDWTPGSQPAVGAGVAKGMAEAFKEIGKLDGVPVYQTMSITGAGQPDAAGSGNAAQQPPQQQEQQPQQTARPSLSGALGSRFGLGRKKQEDTAGSASGSGSSQGGGSGSSQGGGSTAGPGSLMESTTELSAFSAGPVDDSQFAIPAGFKKVEPAQRRGAR
jgi:uncharacterized membrane protein YgcG